MTIKELILELSQYDENTPVAILDHRKSYLNDEEGESGVGTYEVKADNIEFMSPEYADPWVAIMFDNEELAEHPEIKAIEKHL